VFRLHDPSPDLPTETDHEELWQPAWGVRTGSSLSMAIQYTSDPRDEAILGLQGFFPLKGQAAVGVGSVEYPTSERKRLAAM
jgi:ubiquitin-conjugating enzyme E2 J1